MFKWYRNRKRKIQIKRLQETIQDLETQNFPKNFTWSYNKLYVNY